jgi:hypothetical protein
MVLYYRFVEFLESVQCSTFKRLLHDGGAELALVHHSMNGRLGFQL